MEKSPEEALYADIGEGLQKVKDDRFVMHVFEGMLRGYFRENPFHQQELEIFGKGKPLGQV